VSKAVLDTVEWSHAEPINAMQRARVGVLKSGTCNLEGAIAGLPFVCVYSGTHVAKVILSLLVSLKEYSPVNIIRPHTVSELMQVALSPGDLARELEALVSEGSRRAEMERGLAEVRAALKGDANGASSVSERVARCALEMIGAGAFRKAGMSTGV
jgi:lipid A disaccharide synthetase